MSLQNHGHLLLKQWRNKGNDIFIRTADGTVHKIHYIGVIDVKINDVDIGMIQTLLIDSASWKNLLIGKNVLIKHGFWRPRPTQA